MGKATGVFLILAGVGTAALVLPAVDKDAERQLADVVRIATGASPQSAPAAVPAPAVAPTAPPTRSAPPVAAQAPSASPPAIVTAPAATPPALARNTATAAAQPVDGSARADLARDIQKELKRVGCYDGEVSGEWTPATRRAMKSFIERVNAALPIDEPDHILRTMVQGHPGAACGKSCPAGQSASTDGRCLPAAIVAQKVAPKVAVPRDLTEPSSATPLVTGSLAAGAAVAGAVAANEQRAARPAVAPPAPKASWETTVASAPTTPLPGAETRMGIGGPVQPPAVAIVPSTGPRTPNTSGSLVLPGAIAALSGGQSAAASAESGPRQPVARPQKTAAISAEPESEEKRAAPKPRPLKTATAPDPEPEEKKAAKPQVQQLQPRPQARIEPTPVRRAPPPVVVFKYPAPTYLGFRAPKFVASGFPKPERSTFGPRVYENFVRNLR